MNTKLVYVVVGTLDNQCDFSYQWNVKSFTDKAKAEVFARNCQKALAKAAEEFQKWSTLDDEEGSHGGGNFQLKIGEDGNHYVPRIKGVDDAPAKVDGIDFWGTYEEYKTAREASFSKIKARCLEILIDKSHYPETSNYCYFVDEAEEITYTVEGLEQE